MRRILLGIPLVAALVLLFPTVSRAGAVNITLTSGSLIVPEGNSFVLTFTVTNGLSGPITTDVISFGVSILSGDISEFSGSVSSSAGSCLAALGVTLGPGGSCTFTETFNSTTGNPSGETDMDSEKLLDSFVLYYCLGSSLANCPPTPLQESSNFTITVTDPGFKGQTPEPSSLLLLGTGLLGLGPLLRRRFAPR